MQAVSCRSIAAVVTVLAGAGTVAPARAATSSVIEGEIERLTIDPPGDLYAGGRVVVGGQVITLPRNLLVDVPGGRFTLQQLFGAAPTACAGVSGLSRNDPCRSGEPGARATIRANRLANGSVIAGEVSIRKGTERVSGRVTWIDYNQGYFRINGTPGANAAGLVVRVNDPEGRHGTQLGLGCAGGPNCSPDVRFGVEPDNATATFLTGVPLCIPSTVTRGVVPGASNGLGQNDPFCPHTNRGAPIVADSRRFAPLQVGDDVLVEGGFEVVGGVRFLSAWRVEVQASLFTRDEVTQPDFVRVTAAEWKTPAFQADRVRFQLAGATSLSGALVDAFALHVDPHDGAAHEYPLASTVGNPWTIPPGNDHRFAIRYDVDFATGVTATVSPCRNLYNSGLSGCPAAPAIDDELAVLSPISRELVVRSRRSNPPDLDAVVLDANGHVAPSGQFLAPVRLTYFDPDREGQSPHAFSGIPWLADRRLGPGGCAPGGCETWAQPLDPFPFEDLAPWSGSAITPPSAEFRVLAFHPFGRNDRLAWPPVIGAPRSVVATPALAPACTAPLPVQVTLDSMSPPGAPQGSSGLLFLNGTGFQPGPTCDLGPGINLSCTFLSSVQLRGVYLIDPAAPIGTRSLVVGGPGGTVSLSSAFRVTAGPASPIPPTLSAITPNTVIAGDSVTLALSGTGFANPLDCSFGEGIVVRSCNASSEGTATASVMVDPLATAGARLSRVKIGSGLVTSLAGGLDVLDGPATLGPPPFLASISPASLVAGASAVVRLAGTNFTEGALCDFGPGVRVVSCAFVHSGLVVAGVEVPATALGARDVTIVNADGQSSSVPGSLVVLPPAPPPPRAIFVEDFAGPLLAHDLGARWITRGPWSRSIGNAHAAAGSEIALARAGAVADHTVTARLLLDRGTQQAGVAARASRLSWYAAIAIAGKIQLIRNNRGVVTLLREAVANVDASRWSALSLSAAGSASVHLTVGVGGASIFSFDDNSPSRLNGGGGGLVGGVGGTAHFDDFEVRTP